MAKLLGFILRFLFSWIDGITVRLITTIYRLFSDMTQLVVYNDNIVKTIGRRIGLILGIFMLFKLAISLINYMISPDKLSDGKQGGGKLIINIGISLALLISINFIFKEAYFIQGRVVDSRIIEKIFFGESGVILESNSENLNGSQKMDIGYYLYTGFFTPNTEIFDVTCNDMWDVSEPISDECNKLLDSVLDNEEVNEIYRARNSLDMSYVFYNQGVVLAQPTNAFTYAFDYTPIISNAAGIIVLLVLISFSMDLATRAIKLFFLQIIAPIPIISNMDLGKGQDIFKKWGKECINTYLSVFIRLIAINFAVFMIVLLRGNYKDVFINNIWLNIFLIIGCLMFAKQVPKLLEDFLGIKMDGMALNPLKKFEEQALLGKNITGAAAGLAVGTMGTLSGAGAGRFFWGTLGGAIGGKGFSESWKGGVAKNKTMREAMRDGSGFWGRRLTHLTGTLGLPTPSEARDAEIHRLDQSIEDVNRDLQPLKDEMSVLDTLGNLKKQMEQRADAKILEGKSEYSQDVLNAKNKVETLKAAASNINRSNFASQAAYDAEVARATQEITQAESDYNATLKDRRQRLVEDQFQGTARDENGAAWSDAVMHSYIDDYNEKINSNGQYDSVRGLGQITAATSWGAFDAQDTAITNSNQDLKHRSYPHEARKADLEQQKRDIQTSRGYRVAKANERAVGK